MNWVCVIKYIKDLLEEYNISSNKSYINNLIYLSLSLNLKKKYYIPITDGMYSPEISQILENKKIICPSYLKLTEKEIVLINKTKKIIEYFITENIEFNKLDIIAKLFYLLVEEKFKKEDYETIIKFSKNIFWENIVQLSEKEIFEYYLAIIKKIKNL